MKRLASRFALSMTGLIAVLTFVCFCYAQQAQQNNPPQQPEITLQISAVLNQAGPTVAFTVTNNTDKDLTIDGPGVNSSPVVIIKPNGEKFVDVVIVERTGAPPVVKAGQSRTEKGSILPTFNFRRLFEPGVYRLSWRARPHESNVVYTSNELFILREEGTPAIDPLTGLPVVSEKAGSNETPPVK